MANEEAWSNEELQASVDAYADMFLAEREGRKVNKAETYRKLEARFGRKDKAFERRMMNISHVVQLLGGKPVKGLLPAKNIGPHTQNVLEGLIKTAGFISTVKTATTTPTTAALPVPEADKLADELVRKWKSSAAAIQPPSGYNKAPQYSTQTVERKRCAEVKAWVLYNSKGVCECCGNAAPFNKADGTPYLEVHHVVQLADDGPDTVDNTVAVCPNCHRALHLAANRLQLVEGLYHRHTRLKAGNNHSKELDGQR